MRKLLIAAAITVGLSAGAAQAATVVKDPVNDIIQNYKDHHAAPFAASLDITGFSVDLTNGIFLLDATFDGSITDGLPGDYVLGINTRTDDKPVFSGIGEPNVLFNQAVVINKDFSASLGGAPLTATPQVDGGVTDGFKLAIPVGLLLANSTIDPSRFGFSLWSRDGSGGLNSIADFAPDNNTLSAAPEPAAWAMMIFGFGMAGATLRGRRKLTSGRLA